MRVSSLIFSCLIFLLAACGGGKVEYHKDHAQGTLTAPGWINDEGALSKITSARTQEEKENAIREISQHHTPHFLWDRFWENLFKEKPVLKDWPADLLSALFELSLLSSEEKDYRSFSNFLIDLCSSAIVPSEIAFKFLTNSKRMYPSTLGPALTSLVLENLNQRLENVINTEKAVPVSLVLSEILVEQYRTTPSLNWDSTFKTLNQKQWESVASALMHSKNDQALLDLMGVHYHHHHTVSFIPSLAGVLIRDELSLQNAIREFGLEFVLRLLVYYPNARLRQISEDLIKNRLILLSQEFADDLLKEVSFSKNFEKLWYRFLLLRRIQENWDSRLELPFVLTWIENLHRKIEEVFIRDIDSAIEFLESQADYSLDRDWILFRLSQKLPLSQRSQKRFEEELTRVTRVDQIIAARLSVHIEKDEIKKRDKLFEYCRLMSREGIPERKISVDEFQKNPKSVLNPGCTTITKNSSADHLKLNIESWSMPFDTVIYAPNLSLEFHTDRFDGSFFFLDTTKTHPPVPAPAPLPPGSDAIAFPLVVGFKVSEPNLYPDGPGIYYFVLHLSRSAKPGQKSLVTPSQGFSGGTLKIHIRQPTLSYPPTLVSLGGPGQKGPPPQKGGKGNASKVSWLKFQDWFNRLDGDGALEKKGERPIFENPHMTIQALRHLLKHASIIDDQPDLYISPDYISLLEPQDQVEVKQVCRDFPDLRTCYKKYLGPLAVKRIHQIIEENADDNDRESIKHPYLNPEIYEERSGPDGPSSEEGPTGESGLLIWVIQEKGDTDAASQ